jgi:hypothetical protein
MFLLLALLAAPAFGGPQWPDLSIAVGGTTAVSGDPNGGGFSAALSGMWPTESPLAVGLTVFADDMGARLAQFYSTGPSPVALGAYESDHRFAYGAAWRLDASPAPSRAWRPFATATWGYARIQDDARGVILGAVSSTRFGIGAGIRRDVLKSSTLGVVFRYHRLADKQVDQYMSGALEWGWRFARNP